jgi:hypothetical protein
MRFRQKMNDSWKKHLIGFIFRFGWILPNTSNRRALCIISTDSKNDVQLFGFKTTLKHWIRAKTSNRILQISTSSNHRIWTNSNIIVTTFPVSVCSIQCRRKNVGPLPWHSVFQRWHWIQNCQHFLPKLSSPQTFFPSLKKSIPTRNPSIQPLSSFNPPKRLNKIPINLFQFHQNLPRYRQHRSVDS